MTELFTDPEYAVVGYLKSELDAAGIDSFIRNQNATASVIGAPVPMFWPKLCVNRDEDLAAARVIVDRFIAARNNTAPAAGAEWTCPHCGETIPASFEVCWNCSEAREQEAEPV